MDRIALVVLGEERWFSRDNLGASLALTIAAINRNDEVVLGLLRQMGITLWAYETSTSPTLEMVWS